MELEILMARINLKNTCVKLEISLYDIKTKHPKRSDLITSMEQSLSEVRHAILVLEQLEREHRSTSKQNFNLQKINLEQLLKIQQLETQLQTNNYEL